MSTDEELKEDALKAAAAQREAKMNLRDIDEILAGRGWNPISDWWWRVFDSIEENPRRNVVIRGGRRGGKSTTWCRWAVAEALSGKHEVPPDDVGYMAIVSADKGQAKARLKTIAKILEALDIDHRSTAEEITLSDKPVGFRVFAASLTGVVSFTGIGALCDEEARWRDADTGANPAREVLASLRPTMATMPHAVCWHVSSPWSTLDAHHEMVAQGDTDAQRVFRGATWEMNPTLSEADTRALEPDEASWTREYAAIPMSADENRFFAAPFVDAATTGVSPTQPPSRVIAGGDFAFRRDSAAVVALEQCGDVLRLLSASERRPSPGAPLVPSETLGDLVGEMHELRAEAIACDMHYIETVRETTDGLSMPLLEFPTAQDAIASAYVRTRVMLASGRLDLSAAPPKMITQLKETTAQPTASGLAIKNRRTSDGHGDYVSALVCAVWAMDQDPPMREMLVGSRRFQRGDVSDGRRAWSDLPDAID
jgi:hypothetical protein